MIGRRASGPADKHYLTTLQPTELASEKSPLATRPSILIIHLHAVTLRTLDRYPRGLGPTRSHARSHALIN